MLETKRTRIRPIRKEDNKDIFRYRSDLELNKYQDWIPTKLAEVDRFIASNPESINEPMSWFQMVIIEKTTNQIIGDIGIHFKDATNFQSEIGCTIKDDYQDNGFATETLTAIIDFLFKNLNKHRISVSIDPENFNSIKLAEKLGFRKEALFRESLLIRGEWVDDLVYGMLQKEWIHQ